MALRRESSFFRVLLGAGALDDVRCWGRVPVHGRWFGARMDIAGAGGWVRDAGDLQRRPMIGISSLGKNSQMHCKLPTAFVNVHHD
ncbi:hypothetical protein GGI35DRAFT_448548 [Trichoderma velutinum]